MKTNHVRNIPDDVHRTLQARAAIAGISLSDFALKELVRVTQRPSVATVLMRARARARARVGGADSAAIVAAVRAGRERD
ncbi:MAG TPA: hypothetical protein VN892_09690 [Solirubrobacteraceae bacterium]|nr:hypothetical protein [Solirubrobacteraceae bacterium]